MTPCNRVLLPVFVFFFDLLDPFYRYLCSISSFFSQRIPIRASSSTFSFFFFCFFLLLLLFFFFSFIMADTIEQTKVEPWGPFRFHTREVDGKKNSSFTFLSLFPPHSLLLLLLLLLLFSGQTLKLHFKTTGSSSAPQKVSLIISFFSFIPSLPLSFSLLTPLYLSDCVHPWINGSSHCLGFTNSIF